MRNPRTEHAAHAAIAAAIEARPAPWAIPSARSMRAHHKARGTVRRTIAQAIGATIAALIMAGFGAPASAQHDHAAPAVTKPAPRVTVAATSAPRAVRRPGRTIPRALMVATVAAAAIVSACGGGDYCEHPEPADRAACAAEGRATVPPAPAASARI